MFENNVIVARTIEDAWRDSMWCCVRNGYDYIVEKGSYEGQIRRQLEYITIIINEPSRPFLFNVPHHLNFVPTTEERAIQYFDQYLMSDIVAENEDYTYGYYITQQVQQCIELLNISKGHTNQASIFVGEPALVFKGDPPCLRNIDFKVVDGKLNMSVVFRSWDNVMGMPENLCGLQLLKEYVLASLQFDAEDGRLIAFSSGLHIYEQYFDLVNNLNVDKIVRIQHARRGYHE